MPATIFPDVFDYVALGHLHQPQVVAGREDIRYSGAPLAMTFAEASRRKSVALIEYRDGEKTIQPLEVPIFQRLERVRGDWETIAAALARLAEDGAATWLEVEYDGVAIPGDLRRDLAELTAGTSLEILRVRNCRVAAHALEAFDPEETLRGLDEEEVFRRCLEAHQVAEGERTELLTAYRELLEAVRENAGGR
jgi:exonuclease SbcD